MKELTIFENQLLKARIRTLQINGEPWFVLADICAALEIKDAYKVAERLDEDQAQLIDFINPASNTGSLESSTYAIPPKLWIVSESGLWDTVLRSDKPQAKPFRKWVTSEVLPSIRKTGAYISPKLSPAQLTELIEKHIELFAKLGGMDERDRMYYRDALRTQIPSSHPEADSSGEITISDRIVSLMNIKPKRRDLLVIGKQAREGYINKHLRSPPKRLQYVDGAPRMVNSYRAGDLEMIDNIIKEYYLHEGVVSLRPRKS